MPNPKMTGISSITGKTVTIRHATETDMPFIAETLKKNRVNEDDLHHSQFVVAAENDDIIGFGRLRKTGDVYDIGCVFVVESGRRRGIGASIVRHLIEYAPVNRVYTVTDAKAYLRKLGFTEEKQTPKELRGALDVACNLKGRSASVLMTYEKKDETTPAEAGPLYDCIIIGAGPGGLQAAIYLGRFNRKALLIDRGGGRTRHAKYIENFLTQKSVSGNELIDLGMEQARSFNVRTEQGLVTEVVKGEHFAVTTKDAAFRAKFVIVSSGVYDNFPSIDGIYKFLGSGFYTCVDCDGYKTTRKKLLVIGNSINTVRLALGMREMYTDDVTLLLYFYGPPDDYKEELADQGIALIKGEPARIIGEERIEAVELKDGWRLPCEAVMSNFGYKLNDSFLKGLNLKRDAENFKFVTNRYYESSLPGLYVVGPLNTGNDQVVIAAGEGAVAAIDVNKRLMSF